MCTANSYRSPSYLAKVAAGIDVMSGGRLEMGIGAGWYEHEYLGYGYEFPKPSIRIGQMREGVEIMRRMWTEDEVHFEGKYYTLEGGICRPRPLQQPHIPIWVAGGGEKLTLRVAARFADYTNFGMSLDEFVHKSEVLAEHCSDFGRDFDSIVRSTNSDIVIGESEADVAERLDRIRAHYEPYLGAERANRYADRLVESHLVGTPEQIVEQLRPWVAAGLTYLIGYFHGAAYDTSGLELFAAEVAPAFS
jgi:alkanesulfonate monooxygenase SsuD/methylene tetrahydromethanopterin reductase-like flavin-dependent oxidoreductase (luciferase family)